MKRDRKPALKAHKTGRRGRKVAIEKPVIIKAPLTNTLVVTVKSPSKPNENLCKQLKKVFSPDCLTKLQNNPKMQDVIDVSSQLFVRQIVHISEQELKIVTMPTGPTYTFQIVEYDSLFKNYSMDLYSSPAFITIDGKCDYKHIFQNFGKNEAGFKRALHFYFKDDLVYIRHYCTSTEDLDDKLKVCLREIGPKLTLKFKDIKDGVFPEMKIKKTRYVKPAPKKPVSDQYIPNEYHD